MSDLNFNQFVVVQQNRVTPSPFDFWLLTLDFDLDLDLDCDNIFLIYVLQMFESWERTNCDNRNILWFLQVLRPQPLVHLILDLWGKRWRQLDGNLIRETAEILKHEIKIDFSSPNRFLSILFESINLSIKNEALPLQLYL